MLKSGNTGCSELQVYHTHELNSCLVTNSYIIVMHCCNYTLFSIHWVDDENVSRICLHAEIKISKTVLFKGTVSREQGVLMIPMHF
jgi:hypothetical protein